MKIVRVTWRDSHRYMYQMHPTEEVSVTVIESCGYLVSQNKKQIVLCQDVIGDDIRGVIVIPRENVTKVERR